MALINFSITSRLWISIVMSATSRLRTILGSGLRIISAMRLRKPICFFLVCFIAFFEPPEIATSAFVQSVVHWIAPVVMSSWPCQS